MLSNGAEREGKLMREYFKVTSVSERELNKYLDKGWEVIETVKSKEDYGEYVNYHIGFPLRAAFEISKGILKAYEKYELKPQLLQAEAEKIGEDLSEYETFTGQDADNSLVELLEQMDFILTRKDNPKYYKRSEMSLEF